MSGGEKLPIIIPLLEDKDVEWSESLGVFDERLGHQVLGYPSLVAYLKDRARMAASRAHRYVSTARLGRRFKATMASWKHNQISSDQAELLFRAAQRVPDRYPDAEPVLLEIVGNNPEETRKVLDYWRHNADRPGVVVDAELQLVRRRFDYSRKPNGMIEGEFAFTEAAGEAFITTVDALMPPPDDGDDRTASQRRHDAVEDLARGFLEGSEAPEVGGEKPHINVLVDINALQGTPGGTHETETGQVLDVETIRQLSCDGSVSRIVWDGKSEILDVGRRTRVIPAALHRAVIVRDRHCTWKGCTRSPRWCDVHHIISWADGGETAITNLCLLCRYHHTLIHRHEGDITEVLDLRIPEPAGLRPT